MPAYNYIKPVWRNGAIAVTDAPHWAEVVIEEKIARGSRRTGRDTRLVRFEHEPTLHMSFAWLHMPVKLLQPCDHSTYRTGRYLHAFAMDDLHGIRLTPDLASKLLELVYGGDILRGVAAQQQFFEQLEHPADDDVARQLFVGAEQVRFATGARIGGGVAGDREPGGPGAMPPARRARAIAFGDSRKADRANAAMRELFGGLVRNWQS